MVWSDVPAQICKSVGLGKACASVIAFKTFFGDGPAEDADEDLGFEEVFERADFVPDAQGYTHELSDGVEVQVRMAFKLDKYVLQWALPDRSAARGCCF